MLLRKKEEVEAWLNQYLIKNYELIPNEKYGYIVNVYGSVNLFNNNLESIDVKFNEIKENFLCNNNCLISLKGCPEIINGDFWCNNNKLKNLEYSPKIVKGYFDCSNKQLESLKGCPDKLDYLDCHNNNLTSLKSDLKEVYGLNCNFNQLISLEGCPQIINDDFLCNYNNLTSLEGCPKIINGCFECSYNQLISLKGCPEIISKHFYCMNNLLKIKELKYLLKIKECGYIYLKNNKELGKLQDVSNFNQLKEKINIYFEKEDLLNIINKENLSINKIIKKI